MDNPNVWEPNIPMISSATESLRRDIIVLVEDYRKLTGLQIDHIGVDYETLQQLDGKDSSETLSTSVCVDAYRFYKNGNRNGWWVNGLLQGQVVCSCCGK